MQLLSSPSDCCRSCDEELVVNIPGPQGPAGAACTPCDDGINAFTTLSAGFTMPAEGASVTVAVVESAWMVPGTTQNSIVFVQSAGYMQVTAVPTSTSATLKNIAVVASGIYPANAAAGAAIPNASKVSPGGVQGPAGTNGTSGAPVDARYITQIPDATLTNEQALSLLATGYMKSTTATGVVTTQAVPIPIADGGTGGITAAAARTALAAAPNTAAFILKTANAELASAQVLSTLATGYMKVTTATGAITSQAVPIPVVDGGTGGITATAARAALGVLGGYGLLGFKDTVDLNVATSDNAITMLSSRYVIDKIMIEAATANTNTATAGLFTAAGGGGTTLAADQSLAALTASTKFKNLTNAAVVGTDVVTAGTLYFRVGTAQGGADTANVKIYGWNMVNPVA